MRFSSTLVSSSPRAAAATAVLLALFAVFALSARAIASPAPEFEVTKPGGGNAVYARFDFHGPVDVNYFYLSGPHRLVIDVTGAVLTEQKDIEVDSAHVARVRSAQNSRNPDIVRIVFDLKKEFKPAINVYEDQGIISVSESASRPFPMVSVKKHKDLVEIVIPFTEAPVYQREKVENPPRIVMDFQGYAPSEPLVEKKVDDGILKSVRVSHFSTDPDITRVVIETTLPARYEFEEKVGGKKLVTTVHQYSVYGKSVCVDAGHGGEDPGAQVPGIDEKDVDLDVAMKLRDLLLLAGAKVIATRTDDTYIPLKERAEIANRARADIFVSVHANALENHEYRSHIRGIQVLHHSKTSREFANIMGKALSATEAVGNLGIHERKNLVVLRETKMKAVLAELGFMTHPNERELLKDDIFKENAARGLLNGIEDYFGGSGPDLASVELSREMVANLPERPFNYIYNGGGNVLEDDLSSGAPGQIRIPEIPDFIDVLPSYEQGLTHEVGEGPSASASAPSPGGPGN